MERENFGSRLGVLLAMAGSAVGLGNLWRFPYMVGVNGGGAFILVYTLFIVVLCLPIFIAEFIVGRRSQSNALGAFRKLAPGSKWSLVGIITVLTPMIILSYYSVVGGWSLKFFASACSFEFTKEGADLSGMFGKLSTSVWAPIFFHTCFLGLTAAIILAGVKKGIERFSKFMMPLLFLLIVFMAIRTITLPGAKEGLVWLFRPDFSKVNVSMCAAALGQAFFTLSIGFGIVLTYASYVNKDADLASSAVRTTGMDLLFSLIASCAIMPAIFIFGVSPSAGPGLVFQTLPFIFSKMPLGNIAAIIFFATLLVAALTSSVSIFEVGVAYLVEEKSISRRWATLWVFLFAWVIGIICSLSFGPLNGLKLFGMEIFSLLDYISSNILMILGGFLTVIFVGWKLKKEDVRDEFTSGNTIRKNERLFPVVYFIIKWIAPIAIIFIFISNFLN